MRPSSIRTSLQTSVFWKRPAHIDSAGGTALYDAVIAAADHLAKRPAAPSRSFSSLLTEKTIAPAPRSPRPFAEFRTSTAPSSTPSACSTMSDQLRTIAPAKPCNPSATRPEASHSFPNHSIRWMKLPPKWLRIFAINMFSAITPPTPSARAAIAPSASRPKPKVSASSPFAPAPAISPIPTPSSV